MLGIIIKAIGWSRIALIVALIATLIAMGVTVRIKNNALSTLHKQVQTDRIEIENGILKLGQCESAIEHSNLIIGEYESQMLTAKNAYEAEIAKIRDSQMDIKPDVIIRWEKNPTCENAITLIEESHARIWEGL